MRRINRETLGGHLSMNRHRSVASSPLLNLPVSVLLGLQLFAGMVVAPCFAFFPVYLSDLGYSVVLISTIVMLQRASGLVASLVGGNLSDTAGRKLTLLLGQIGFLSGTLLFVFRSVPAIAVLWSVAGFGMALMTLGGQSYLMDRANARHLGVLTAFYYWGYTLGATVSNTITGFVLERLGYRRLGILLALGGLLVPLVTLLFLPPSHRSSSNGGPRRDTPDRPPEPTSGVIAGYLQLAGRREVLLLGILRFLPTFCYGMMTVFIPLLLRAAGALHRTIAFYAAVSSISASLAQLLVGRTADRVGPRTPSVIAFTVLVAAPAGIAAMSHSLTAVFVLGTIAIAAAWSLSTLLPPMVSLVADADQRGRILGFAHLFWNTAMILSAVAGGFLFRTGKGLPFLVGAAGNAVALVLVFSFFRISASREMQRSSGTDR